MQVCNISNPISKPDFVLLAETLNLATMIGAIFSYYIHLKTFEIQELDKDSRYQFINYLNFVNVKYILIVVGCKVVIGLHQQKNCPAPCCILFAPSAGRSRRL